MDRKEAIEYAKFRLECHTKGDGEYTDYGEFLVAAIEALQEPQVGGWIPVSERLPDVTGNYLVISKGSTWVANWFNGTWWGIEKKCRWTDVEAWQPLPEPYKESEEE